MLTGDPTQNCVISETSLIVRLWSFSMSQGHRVSAELQFVFEYNTLDVPRAVIRSQAARSPWTDHTNNNLHKFPSEPSALASTKLSHIKIFGRISIDPADPRAEMKS